MILPAEITPDQVAESWGVVDRWWTGAPIRREYLALRDGTVWWREHEGIAAMAADVNPEGWGPWQRHGDPTTEAAVTETEWTGWQRERS